jgi:hypothetical protein
LGSSCGHKTFFGKLHPQPAPRGWGYTAAKNHILATGYAHFVMGFTPAGGIDAGRDAL